MDSLVSVPVAASGDFSTDAARFSAYWRDAKQQLARLPAKPKRDAAAHDAAETLKQAARDARFAFLRRHARTLYGRLTDGRRKFVRVEQLVYDAADVCILDPQSQVAVLRGDVVPDGKYAGQRVYNAGINLTHLYYGKIPFLWFLVRDLGFVNKMLRGLAKPEVSPDEVSGESIEKLWISAVETFAIGGGCQILLATDFNIAERGAYLTLPARKEGIIPAMANLRLARFVGDRIARQAIMYERRIECDSDVGRMICDEVVAPGAMDETIAHVIDRLTGSGVGGPIGNRRALRFAAEPLDPFPRHAAPHPPRPATRHSPTAP